MNASTLLKVGITSWVLGTCWARTLEAAADYVSTVRISAPAAQAHIMRARLQHGSLLEVPADHCRHAVVYFEAKGSRWRLQFTRGDSTVIRNVKSPEIAAGWRDRRVAKYWAGPTLGAQVMLGYSIADWLSLVGRAEATLLLAERVESTIERGYFDSRGDDSERVDCSTTEQRLTPTLLRAPSLGLFLVVAGDPS